MFFRAFCRIRSPVVRFILAVKIGIFSFLFSLFFSAFAHADWVPLVTTDNFTGPQADLMTVVGGVLVFTLIVMAAGMVVGMLRGRG